MAKTAVKKPKPRELYTRPWYEVLTDLPGDAQPYRPHGACLDLFYCRDSEVLIEGPARTGKTRAILEKCHMVCQKYPRCRILWTRKVQASMPETVLQTFEDHVLPAGHPMTYGMRSHRTKYRYSNGSEIIIAGLDKVEKIMSSEYDIVCAFEATELTEHDWEMCQTRLSSGVIPYQQGIADCNPEMPQHWLNRRASRRQMTRLRSVHFDNPKLYDPLLRQYTKTGQDLIRRLGGLGGARRKRLFEGLWAAAEGQVYPNFDQCIVEHFTPPPGRLYGGIDWGWQAPLAALGAVLYVAEDGRDVLYVFYERYKSKVFIEEHAKALPSGHLWYADNAEPRSIVKLRKCGHRCRPAPKGIIASIDAVTSRIETGRLQVSKACRALITEMSYYRFKNDGTEKPVHEFSHAVNALEYMIMGIDRHARPWWKDDDPARRSVRDDPEAPADLDIEGGDLNFTETENAETHE